MRPHRDRRCEMLGLLLQRTARGRLPRMGAGRRHRIPVTSIPCGELRFPSSRSDRPCNRDTPVLGFGNGLAIGALTLEQGPVPSASPIGCRRRLDLTEADD